jgi:acyl-CoA reductase-like NAD-dependent aldehyde dehydrogenase
MEFYPSNYGEMSKARWDAMTPAEREDYLQKMADQIDPAVPWDAKWDN